MDVAVELVLNLASRYAKNTDNEEQMSRSNEEDSWEIRAFERDTIGNMLGCTWPPRFYTCTFCRREFRSAQALGGHMNVHRRDRGKLCEVSPISHSSIVAKNQPSSIFLPAQKFVTNGLCLVYPMPNPKGALIGREMNASMDSSSPLTASDSPNFATDKSSNATSPLVPEYGSEIMGSVTDSTAVQEIDLELRLGRKSPWRWG